jgi:hypothetical protein
VAVIEYREDAARLDEARRELDRVSTELAALRLSRDEEVHRAVAANSERLRESFRQVLADELNAADGAQIGALLRTVREHRVALCDIARAVRR